MPLPLPPQLHYNLSNAYMMEGRLQFKKIYFFPYTIFKIIFIKELWPNTQPKKIIYEVNHNTTQPNPTPNPTPSPNPSPSPSPSPSPNLT